MNESDHTISIYTDAEVIETTAIHPFYTENGWKDASELEAGEKILSKDQTKITIEKTEYSYEPKKVYNFTVAHFHTYFVGLLALLVHNAKGRCLSSVLHQLKNFKTKSYIVGKTKIILDNKGLKHILERHHPKYWDGSVKEAQTFLSKNMDIKDIEKGIGEVIKQNRAEILKNGTRRGQYKGIVDGIERTIGLNKGRIGQFF